MFAMLRLLSPDLTPGRKKLIKKNRPLFIAGVNPVISAISIELVLSH